MKKYITEFIGTFFLVLVIAFTGNPLAIGGSLAALVYMGGYISGANYNPAITLGLLASNKIKPKTAFLYMLIQLIAGICAAFAYFVIHGSVFVPEISSPSSFLPSVLVEILFTFLLVSVVLHVAATDKTRGNDYYGIAIGLALMAAVYAAGPISGGAINPAAGIGPILFDIRNIQAHSVSLLAYFIGPFVGGALASIVYNVK